MGKKSAEEEEEPLPDHLRCGRSDGRQWRCRRRVMDNLKLCEIHHLQGLHRQHKEKVPESLKLQRNNNKGQKKHNPVPNNAEIRARKAHKMAKLITRKRKASEASEKLVGPARKKLKQGDVQIQLIKMVLKREVEKRKKKKQGEKRKKNQKKKKTKKKKIEVEEEEALHHSEGELTRELPNGVMAISPAATPKGYNCNVGSHCDVKVGADDKAVTPRYLRSKNVERLPVGKLQVVPYGRNLKKGKRKNCHWCQSSDSLNLIKCSRYFDTQNGVKMSCPVCQGTCTCKDCLASHCKESESKEYLAGENRVNRILHFHYLICMLLPVLKKISEGHDIELEREAKVKGIKISDIPIKQVEFGCNEQNHCNRCKTPILDLHRSCPSCSYSLCLGCCQELSQANVFGEMKSPMSKLPVKMKACIASESHLLDEAAVSSGTLTATPTLSEWTNCNGIDCVSCPPTELGGCGSNHLDLRCVFPLSWIKEMEVKAEEIVCSYDFPETLDTSSSCSLCPDTNKKSNRHKQLQEASLREDSNDNCLFYPRVSDISGDNFEHFQKHWGKGHPILVRDVIKSRSNISWDPLAMFRSYLELSITSYENNKDLLESCLDWCEVEINIRQYFTGSLKCQPRKNAWHEMLKLKGWLSSQLFIDQFPSHFAEVIDALPIPEYMNPIFGVLNLAANLPHGSAKHDLGPYVYISYGCAEKQADSVRKLCYDSYDVCCVHVVLEFVSPENVTECIRLMDEIQLLPEDHKAKVEKLEVRKMALYSMSAAIKEMSELTCKT